MSNFDLDPEKSKLAMAAWAAFSAISASKAGFFGSGSFSGSVSGNPSRFLLAASRFAKPGGRGLAFLNSTFSTGGSGSAGTGSDSGLFPRIFSASGNSGGGQD